MPSPSVKRWLEEHEEEQRQGATARTRLSPPGAPSPSASPLTRGVQQMSIDEDEDAWDLLSPSSGTPSLKSVDTDTDDDGEARHGEQSRTRKRNHPRPPPWPRESNQPDMLSDAPRPATRFPLFDTQEAWQAQTPDTRSECGTEGGAESESGVSALSAVSSNAFDPVFFPDRCATPTQTRPHRFPSTRHGVVCQLCSEEVRGIRWICKECPNWNVCETCFEITAEEQVHPIHTFIRTLSPADIFRVLPDPFTLRVGRVGKKHWPAPEPRVHLDIQCHNCEGSIVGVRYDCGAVACQGLPRSFCQDCEALPLNCHPPSHPLIKYKVPKHGQSEPLADDWQTAEDNSLIPELDWWDMANNSSGSSAPPLRNPLGASNPLGHITPFPPPSPPSPRLFDGFLPW